jgi:hypothetical protein
MKITQERLDSIITDMYSDIAEQTGRPAYTNLAQSNQCLVLTQQLYGALYNRNEVARREHHELGPEDGRYHYLIAHEPEDQVPSDDDVITDLNPWQFMPNYTASGYLHAPRSEVMQRLTDTGAPEWYVSLRGIQTIANQHIAGFRR